MAVREMTPPALAPAALNALKHGRRMTLAGDDALLAGLLRSAMALCEAFTGQTLLARDFEEVLPVQRDWQRLARMPVIAITGVGGIPAEGAEFVLPVDAYAIDIDGDGFGGVRLRRPGSAGRIRVAYRAGMTEEWTMLPEALREGVLLQAAHLYAEADGPASAPPAAVAALWRPCRRMRLA
ncbi:MAG: hypothetical protein R3E02_06375 [Blastomonas sp.]